MRVLADKAKEERLQSISPIPYTEIFPDIKTQFLETKSLSVLGGSTCTCF